MTDTQCSRLLKALKAGPVDPLLAWRDLGIYRLAPRVLDLRRAGYEITRKTKTVRNQFGEPCRVAEYSLENNRPKGKNGQ